jgi:hypothetical protein
MIKVFGMARGGTNILCNMIYSFPEVERPRYSELQNYIYKRNTLTARIRQRFEKLTQKDHLSLDNYDIDKKSGEKYRKIMDSLRDNNFLFKIMNGNIAYYDFLNRPGDRNIILLRNKMSVFGSMIRRGEKPVKAINNINNFYRFADFFSKRDQLPVIHFEDILKDYNKELQKITDYLKFNKIDKVYFGLKETLTQKRLGRKRVLINVIDASGYIDKTINDKQKILLESLFKKDILLLYENMMSC